MNANAIVTTTADPGQDPGRGAIRVPVEALGRKGAAVKVRDQTTTNLQRKMI